MLSKEEYTLADLREHCIKTMQFSNRNSNTYKEHELIISTVDENISLKYKINQLETEKADIIKKLEERIKESKSKSGGNTYHVQLIINAEIREVENILSIMKGEKKC